MPLGGPRGLLRMGDTLHPGKAGVAAAASLAPLPAQRQTQHTTLHFFQIFDISLHRTSCLLPLDGVLVLL